MTPKPLDPHGSSGPEPPLSPHASPRSSGKKELLQQAAPMIPSLPTTLVVLGVFGKDDDAYEDWTEEDGDNFVKMPRYRLNTTDKNGEEYDPALMIPIEGLTHPDGHHIFYHNDMDELETEEDKIEGRAVLFQSIENYETVSREPTLQKYFYLHDRDQLPSSPNTPLSLTDQELVKERTLNEGVRFGEQVVVQGATPHDICVGDVFEVTGGGESTLKFQVTCPRKPCYYVDEKNNTPKGRKGVKQFCMSRGLAGWFTRVLTQGNLQDGMILTRTQCLYPKWTCAELSQALYGGEGDDPKAILKNKPTWGRSKAELQELIDMGDLLCECEWGEELPGLMKQMEQKEEAERLLREEEEAKNQGIFDLFSCYFADMMDSMCSMHKIGCFDEDLVCGPIQCGAY